MPSPPIALDHLQHTLRQKTGVRRLIPPREQYPIQPIELLKLHGRGWVSGHDPHDGALDLRGRSEVVLSDLHDVIDFCVQLDVC